MTETKSARVFSLHIVEVIFVFLVAGTENYKLHILSIHKFFKSHSHKVKSLVGNKSCNHSNHRNIPTLFKAKSFLKRTLALALAAHIILRIVAVQLIVGFRIITYHINAVLNSAKFVVAKIKFIVKSVTVPWVLDFGSIARRYC